MEAENKEKVYVRPSQRPEFWDTSTWPMPIDKWAMNKVKRINDLLDTLNHAWHCVQKNCDYPECRGMKIYFKHRNACEKNINDCIFCTKLRNLCIHHVRSCILFHGLTCESPFCPDLKQEYLDRKEGRMDVHQPLRSLIAPKTLQDNTQGGG